jgi:hypothetical protein
MRVEKVFQRACAVAPHSRVASTPPPAAASHRSTPGYWAIFSTIFCELFGPNRPMSTATIRMNTQIMPKVAKRPLGRKMAVIIRTRRDVDILLTL